MDELCWGCVSNNFKEHYLAHELHTFIKVRQLVFLVAIYVMYADDARRRLGGS